MSSAATWVRRPRPGASDGGRPGRGRNPRPTVTTLQASRTFRFTGADRFILMLDRELRRVGAAGFQAALGVELEGRLERPRLARAFDAVRRAHPRLCARLVPARGLSDWHLRVDRGLLELDHLAWSRVRAQDGGDPTQELTRFTAERTCAPLDPRTASPVDLAVREIAPGPGENGENGKDGAAAPRTLLVLRFWHPVLDERGGEILLRELAAAYAGEPLRAGGDEPPPVDGGAPHERRAGFRRARARLAELTPAPPHRLPAGAPDAPAEWVFERTVLDAAATDAWLASTQASAGALGEGLAQLALVARALAQEARDDAFIALPLTVQLRAPRARAPVAANAVSFLWYAFQAGATRAPREFAARVLAVAREKVAAGEERDASILLERARRMPLSIYRRELSRRDGSSRFSATLSTIGEVLNGARELFGLPLRDFIGLPAFPSPPGLGFAFSRAAGRLSLVTAAWTRDVARASAAGIHARIARELAHPQS